MESPLVSLNIRQITRVICYKPVWQSRRAKFLSTAGNLAFSYGMYFLTLTRSQLIVYSTYVLQCEKAQKHKSKGRMGTHIFNR
ncbi:hypothetical protein D3C77_419440 [compost metagenome]